MDAFKAPEDVTKEWLDKELSTAQDQLDRRVKKLEADNEESDDSSWDDNGGTANQGSISSRGKSKTPSVTDHLLELNDTAEALALVQEVSQWAQESSAIPDDAKDFFLDAEDCVNLANILRRHPSQSSLYKNLYEREYQPLHDYVRTHLIRQLRHILLKSGYPSSEGCAALLDDTGAPSPLTQCCEWLTRIQATNFQVANHTHQTSVSSSASPWSMGGETCDVLVELFRPIVERVRFHFVDYNSERATTSKMDRLPEWLLTYLSEHVIEGKPSNLNNATINNNSSPWELISLGLAPYVTEEMPVLFLNELVGLVQWVLGSERNFFRHANIAGPHSKPMLLCNAIEHLLEFDDTLRSLLPMGQADRLLRLMDIFVAGDEELLSWWLAREKEMVFATLFDNDKKEKKQDATSEAIVKTRISPRAELFCALIRSVQVKASVFSFSGPYLNAVAVPLCMSFLDAVHESSSEMQRNLASPRVLLQGGHYLTENIENWMAVINGTHLAAAILTRESPWAQESMAPGANSCVNDLARFGRSLEQLQNVLVEEFASTFVESLLMEQMKLAGYLMRCSHFLSHDLDDEEREDYIDADVSPDLKPTAVALAKFLTLCSETDESEERPEEEGHNFATKFAPRIMRAHVMPLLADKFLEVALDLHGLTPDILPEGARIFAHDMETLFESSASTGDVDDNRRLRSQFRSVFRILEVSKLMSMDSKNLKTLQTAMLGLVGGPRDRERPWLIHSYQFTNDETLYEEAICMIRAKGFSALKLEDAISVLNRRQDLMIHPRAGMGPMDL